MKTNIKHKKLLQIVAFYSCYTSDNYVLLDVMPAQVRLKLCYLS